VFQVVGRALWGPGFKNGWTTTGRMKMAWLGLLDWGGGMDGIRGGHVDVVVADKTIGVKKMRLC